MESPTKERWQTKIRSLKEGISHIYDTKEFADGQIIVGSKVFKIHRHVLASKCAELGRIFENVNEYIEEDESVTDIGVEVLLRYIYQDTLGTDDKSAIIKAFTAAKIYNQTSLKERCENSMDRWAISMNEVCDLLNDSLSIPKLKNKCLHFIRTNAQDVIESEGFLRLDSRAVTAILDEDVLRDIPLNTRIMKLLEWGGNSHTKPVNYSLVRQDFMSNDPSLMGKLRLEELPMEDFNKLAQKTCKGLLTTDEIMKFMNYYAETDRSDLPEWCNVRKEQ